MTKTECCTDQSLPVLGGVDFVDLASKSPGELPVLGSPKFATTFSTNYGKWPFYFISKKNKKQFEADPWKYAPAWGGFCACGVAREPKMHEESRIEHLGPEIDLSSWTRAPGSTRPFFARSPTPLSRFEGDPEAVENGDATWSMYWMGQLQDGVFNTNCFIHETYEDLTQGVRTPLGCVLDDDRPDPPDHPCGEC